MPEALTASQQHWRDAAAALVKDVLDGPLRGAERRQAIVAAARASGLFGLTQPASHGGTPADQTTLVAVRECLAASGARDAEAALGPSPGVLAGASGVLAERFLHPLLRGERRGVFGFTEARDATRPTVAVPDGDMLRVTGMKPYVTGAVDADFVCALVHVQGPDRAQPAMLAIDLDTPGVTVGAAFHSLDGSHHAPLTFADAQVPASHLIGAPGEGLPRALRQIGDVRLGMAAQACGLMQYALALTERNLTAPHRSGEALAAREGVRLRYADLRIRAYAARSMLYRTARLADSGANAVNETMATKVFCTETVGEVVDGALQLAGGMALVDTHPLAQLYRRVRAMRFAEGASDVLRLNVARGRFELGLGRL